MSDSDTHDGHTSPASEQARDAPFRWDHVDPKYKEWVKCDIADRLTIKIIAICSGIGLFSIGAIGGVYYTFQGMLNENLKSQIVADLAPTIGTQISYELASKANIIKKMEEQIGKVTDQYLEHAGVQRELKSKAEQILREPGILDKVIRERAYEIGNDTELSPTFRAFGIRLFAAFHQDEQIPGRNTAGLREYLLALMKNPPGKELAADVFQAILELYPLEHDGSIPDLTCFVTRMSCADSDDKMFDAVISFLEDPHGQFILQNRNKQLENALISFLNKIASSNQQSMLRRWRAMGHQINFSQSTEFFIISAWAKSDRDELLEEARNYLVQFTPPKNETRRRAVRLAFLATLPADFAVDAEAGGALDWRRNPTMRKEDLEWILTHFTPEELWAAWTDAIPQPGEQASPIAAALVNRLRVIDTAERDQKSEWSVIVEPLLDDHPEHAPIVLRALSARIAGETSAFADTVPDPAKKAAGELLDFVTRKPALLSDDLVQAAMIQAIGHAEWSTVDRFAMVYLSHQTVRAASDEVLRAVVAHDKGRDYQWLRTRLDDTPKDQAQRLLASVLGHAGPAGPTEDDQSRTLHRALADYVVRILDEKGGDTRLADALLTFTLRDLNSERPIDQSIALAGLEQENSTLLTDFVSSLEKVAEDKNSIPNGSKVLQSLRRHRGISDIREIDVAGDELRWSALPAPDKNGDSDDAKAALRQSAPPAAGPFGGVSRQWRRLTSEKERWVKLEPHEDVVLVAFKDDQSTELERSAGRGGSITLPMEVMALQRSARPGGSITLPMKAGEAILVAAEPHVGRRSDVPAAAVKIRSYTTPILGPRNRQAPLRLDAPEFEAVIPEFEAVIDAPDGGEMWLSVALGENQRLTVETGAAPDSPEDLDSVVYLIDTATGETLGWNDDGPGLGGYSRLQHTSWHDREVLIGIVQFDDRPFEPDTEFSVTIDVTELGLIGATVGASTRDAPHKLAAEAPALAFAAGDAGGEAWLRTSLAANRRLTVETRAGRDSPSDLDTVVYLLDAETNRQLARNDDGPGLGLYSRLQHTAWHEQEVLVRIVQLGDQPFEPGTKFVVDVDVEPMPEPEVLRELELSNLDEPLVFAATEERPEALYRVSLAANERLTVETGARPDSPEGLNTVVYLLDAATGRQLAQNDDGRDLGRYSRLQHMAWLDTEAVIRIVQIGDRSFQPGTEFTVEVDIESVDPLPTLSDFPERSTFAATEERPEGWYRVVLEAGQTISVETGRAPGGPEIDTVAILLDAATGEELARNDDGPGPGFFSRATYTAEIRTELIVRIIEIRERPFAPGTRFTVDVDVVPHDQRAAIYR